MLDDALGILLDAPHLCTLLNKWEGLSARFKGIIVSEKLYCLYEAAMEEFRAKLAEFRALEIQGSTLIESPSALACEASQRYPFLPLPTLGSGDQASSNALEDYVQKLISIGRTLLPEHPIDSVQDINQCIEALQTILDENETLFYSTHAMILMNISKASRDISFIDNAIQRVHAETRPIAEEYLATLSEYLMAVVDSLYLKLQILEAETRRVCYPLDRLADLAHGEVRAVGVIEELDNAIKVGQTNLLLFHQLGPAVSNIALQYQQILARIELVTEDLQGLSRR